MARDVYRSAEVGPLWSFSLVSSSVSYHIWNPCSPHRSWKCDITNFPVPLFWAAWYSSGDTWHSMSPIRSALEINTGPPFWILQGSNTRLKTSTCFWPILRPLTVSLSSKFHFILHFSLTYSLFHFYSDFRRSEMQTDVCCLTLFFPPSSIESAASACSWRWAKFLSVCKSKTMFIKHLLLPSAPAVANHGSALYIQPLDTW